MPLADRKHWSKAKQRECARLKGLGHSFDEIAEKIGSHKKHVFKLLAREYALPGPDTETHRGIEVRKLDVAEQRANQMYLTNLSYEERVIDGNKVRVQVVPPNVLTRYVDAMDKVAGRRHRLLGLEMPIKHVIEEDITAKLLACESVLPPEYMLRVADVFSGGSGGEEVQEAAAARGGGQTSH